MAIYPLLLETAKPPSSGLILGSLIELLISSSAFDRERMAVASQLEYT